MSDTTLPTMLAPDGIKRSVDEALARLKEEVPGADIGGVKMLVTPRGATVNIYTKFRVRHVDGVLGAEIDRTWTGDITAEGYVALRW